VNKLLSTKDDKCIRALAGSGKTSILQLCTRKLEERGEECHLIGMRNDVDSVVDKLKGIGLDFRGNSVEEKEMTVLLDDAQEAFGKAFDDFWFWLIKQARVYTSAKKIRLIIAATEYLSGDASVETPARSTHWSFKDLLQPFGRGARLPLTNDEMDTLFEANAKQSQDPRWCEWNEYRDTLKSISGGNAGAFQAGIIILEDQLSEPKDRGFKGLEWTESDAISKLTSPIYLQKLSRCFPKITNEDEKERIRSQAATVSDMLLKAELTGFEGDVEEIVPETIALRRIGILGPDGRFASPAAAIFYYSEFFPGRSLNEPTDMDSLLTNAVVSLSASGLQDSVYEDGKCPLEIVLHQHFRAAFVQNTPAMTNIHSERPAEDIGHKRRVDFFINNKLGYAYEFLRDGSAAQQHVDRFDKTNGQYRNLPFKDFRVVDVRGPYQLDIEEYPENKGCTTVTFTDGYKSARIARYADGQRHVMNVDLSA